MPSPDPAPYPSFPSFLWTLLRDLVAALLTSLALALGWFSGVAIRGPEDWLARALALVSFLLLSVLSALTLRELLFRAADTAIRASRPERSRVLAELTALSIGLGCLLGAGGLVWMGKPRSTLLGGIALCVGLPLLLIGGAALWVRQRIARRAAKAQGGFDPREIDVPHAPWPQLVLLAGLIGSGAIGLATGPRVSLLSGGTRELSDGGRGDGELDVTTPYIEGLRARMECWRLDIRRPGIYRVTVRAAEFAPLAVLTTEPRAETEVRRAEARGTDRVATIEWSWESQRPPYLFVGSAQRDADGPYETLLERVGP